MLGLPRPSAVLDRCPDLPNSRVWSADSLSIDPTAITLAKGNYGAIPPLE